MKKHILCVTLALIIPTMMLAQTFSNLWDKVEAAQRNDLPQTEQSVLLQILKKAEREKNYGQLLKAELQYASSQASVSPDSLQPAVERLKEREQSTADSVVRAVYQSVLGYIYAHNNDLGEDHMTQSKEWYTRALTYPRQLATAKATVLKPFVIEGSDSRLYDNNLLSVICYECGRYDVLRDYYLNAGGNRRALMLSSLMLLKQQRPVEVQQLNKSPYIESLDSLINKYADLTETGEAAIERYEFMDDMTNATTEQKWQYLNMALERWGSWQKMNALRNAQRQLSQQQYNASVPEGVNIPMRQQTVKLTDLRGVNNVTMRVYRVKSDKYVNLNPNFDREYKMLKPMLEPTDISTTRTYVGKKPYELYEDSITLPGLPAGIYMLEFESQPQTDVSRALYYVSNVRTMALSLPDRKLRYVVVDAVTGQPVKAAKIELKSGFRNEMTVATLTTDANGEAQYTMKGDDNIRSAWVTTKKDWFCPPLYGYGRFSYYGSDRVVKNVEVYTDRSIYRPGQTVHVGAIIYRTEKGYINQAAEGYNTKISLRDANYKLVSEQKVTTDENGTCTADFTLPSQGLTGQFSVHVDGHSHYIRVEEYKRPTFEVVFPEMNQHYEDGDTVVIKASARSYAGVPVQGAKVTFKIERRRAYWWWYYSRYWNQGAFGTGSDDNEIGSGEAVTDADGQFTVEVPMTLPKTRYPMFYNFVITAEVTDQGGETHHGEMSLPLGNRKTAFSSTMAEKVLMEKAQPVTFNLRNAAGIDISAEVKYRIDNGSWQQTKTTTATKLPLDRLKSGSHKLTAICEGDTIEQEFTLFSLADRRPAVKTDDWFFISDTQFPNDGTPVTYQVGSSDDNVHMVYAIIGAEKVLESGFTDKSNELVNRSLTYDEAYGNGVLLTYAWVKNGVTYRHSATIKRPTPDMKLKMQWQTFRNRLQPGQQEEWTLTVTGPDGKPVSAQLMATLYDKSLDQIAAHNWALTPYQHLPLPSTGWTYSQWSPLSFAGYKYAGAAHVPALDFNHFDHDIYPSYFGYHTRMYKTRYNNGFDDGVTGARPMMMLERATEEAATADAIGASVVTEEAENDEATAAIIDENAETGTQQEEPQVRENLQETAFFFPQLMADSTGNVHMKFTLPESLTTWRFLGIAHTKDMMYGTLTDETIAQKDVMIQPNMPRFVRHGDKAAITARIFNITENAQRGTARLTLTDPETERVVYDEQKQVAVDPNGTTSVTFNVDCNTIEQSLLVAKITVSGKSFSDGEQHYLPILPDRERVTVTRPFTQNAPGTTTIDLAAMMPVNDPQGKFTFEYTNNPAWLMIQALPTVGHPHDNCIICQTTSYYANSIGRHIIRQNPQAKHVFEAWTRETGDETSLSSNLQRNQELLDLVLSETPWVTDADRESEQKQQLRNFFDENLMQTRISQALEKMQKMQKSDGSWSWWPDMPGSFYMTTEITEMLVRLNQMTGTQTETEAMLEKSFKFLGNEIVIMVDEMKREEQRGVKQTFPSHKALQWLYSCTIDGRELPSRVKRANEYLINLLKKETKRQSIYDKAMSAIVLNNKTYIKSLKEYTVYREDMGRYYDTDRALYSWRDYRIPTQVAAIEAIQRLTPDDSVTLDEMRRWLLQEKRTQAWDTPINSVDAVYAFLNNKSQVLAAQPKTRLSVDGQELLTPEATAGLGYVKTALPLYSLATEGRKPQTFTAEKTSTGTSWGAVYAQFMQQTTDIADQQSGIKVTRELFTSDHSPLTADHSLLKVGNRVTVRITIEADRDYDFVEVIDRRAACMEPVNQLSGYQWRTGFYCAPKDNSTNYYFDRLRKGKHVIEAEFYIDREGTYTTGTCTVQCAYSPEFRASTHAMTLEVTSE